MPKAAERRKSRELALQVLFQQEFAPNLEVETGLQTFRGNFQASGEVWRYAHHILKGIEEQKPTIDDLISSYCEHWALDRLALVDLNIMRIAVFELRDPSEDVPPRVAVNEALEIAKLYSTTESASFINGILDPILNEKALS